MSQNSSEVNVPKTISVVGDIHGHYTTLINMLQQSALIDHDLVWIGGQSVLCLIGDYVDRGPHGIDCIELVMRLQSEARADGGDVVALLGNHEVLLLSAYYFGIEFAVGSGRDGSVDVENLFVRSWLSNGGERNDLGRLTETHVEWLTNLPAVALVENHLLIHADSMFYATYGDSIDEINESFQEMLSGRMQRIWVRLLNEFSVRNAFIGQAVEGKKRVLELLELLGGRTIIHGHTPIGHVLGQEAETITKPLIYADAYCINVDGGICHGGPGFIYQFFVSSPQISIHY